MVLAISGIYLRGTSIHVYPYTMNKWDLLKNSQLVALEVVALDQFWCLISEAPADRLPLTWKKVIMQFYWIFTGGAVAAPTLLSLVSNCLASSIKPYFFSSPLFEEEDLWMSNPTLSRCLASFSRESNRLSPPPLSSPLWVSKEIHPGILLSAMGDLQLRSHGLFMVPEFMSSAILVIYE